MSDKNPWKITETDEFQSVSSGIEHEVTSEVCSPAGPLQWNPKLNKNQIVKHPSGRTLGPDLIFKLEGENNGPDWFIPCDTKFIQQEIPYFATVLNSEVWRETKKQDKLEGIPIFAVEKPARISNQTILDILRIIYERDICKSLDYDHTDELGYYTYHVVYFIKEDKHVLEYLEIADYWELIF